MNEIDPFALKLVGALLAFLSTVTIAIGAWTLKSVHELAKSQAAQREHSAGEGRRIDRTETRLDRVEEAVNVVERDVAALQRRRT